MKSTEAEALAWIAATLADNPIARHLSARPVACDVVHGRLSVEFASRPELLNLLGIVHGGVLAAMLDISMSFAAIATAGPGHVVPTIEMSTKYIAPAQPGILTGKGEVVHKGRSITFMEGRLYDASGALLATGAATGRLRPWPPHKA